MFTLLENARRNTVGKILVGPELKLLLLEHSERNIGQRCPESALTILMQEKSFKVRRALEALVSNSDARTARFCKRLYTRRVKA